MRKAGTMCPARRMVMKLKSLSEPVTYWERREGTEKEGAEKEGTEREEREKTERKRGKQEESEQKARETGERKEKRENGSVIEVVKAASEFVVTDSQSECRS